MKTVTVDGLRFGCETELETWRAEALLTKEPGTIAWLDTLPVGSVLYDVGANIGVYTLYAARRVGPDGMVYAFEPHVANAVSLLRNVQANGFQDRVRVLTCALHSSSGCRPFYYRSLMAASSGSQLGHQRDEEDTNTFTPKGVELKVYMSVRQLIVKCIARVPYAIKIDVDGNELEILRGALVSYVGNWPLTIQVEMHAFNRKAIADFLVSKGYQQTGQHFTKRGQQAVASGADPATIADNGIFTRVA